jgi:hypothetical protein
VRDKLISYDGWPDCYPERYSFTPYCSNVALLLGAKGCGQEIILSHPEKNAGYKEAELSEGIGASSPTRLAFRDTEDDLKILLTILSIHNYFCHPPSRSG